MDSPHLPKTAQPPQTYPFDSYEYLSSTELSEVESAVARIFEPRHYKAKGPGQVRGSLVRLPCLDVGGACFSGDIHERFTSPAENYFLLAPQSGGILANHSQQDARAQHSALLLSPGDPVDLYWKDCSVVLVRIRPDVIQEFAQQHQGTDGLARIQLPTMLDMQQGTGLSIANLLRSMATEMEDEQSLLSRGISGRAMNEMLLTALMYTNLEEEPQLPGQVDNKLKLAVEYVMANLRQDIAISDLVKVTGVSARKLQSDFSRRYGLGPMSFIKMERLKRVREELSVPHRTGTNVADVAFAWGFTNPSHFTQLYKKHFGETPSETLNRRH
ncbi:AraC family transcriptional regulator [Pseudomaricurvus alkylphenolicus]|uniref:AraC family transcriptional regulator n=1 Tax=Pseudomaricurvus alkylphenolicus TaxID=1306991 RepID=UPI0014212280|nr:AraC family transcriptional regulator [Pseudomaricurvus alkylphenolicus]NIB41507.1 AraC family transcriptional regulator [Pseudomaricurvus alkylphenolicus]